MPWPLQVNGLFDCGFKQGKFDARDIIDPYGGLADIQQKNYAMCPPLCRRSGTRIAPCPFCQSLCATWIYGWWINHETYQPKWKPRASWVILSLSEYGQRRQKALTQAWSDIYFDTLFQLNVLDVIMPKLYQASIDNPSQWQLMLSSLRMAESKQADNVMKFALVATCFKSDQQHNSQTTEYLEFCQGLKVPKTLSAWGYLLLSILMN